MNAAIGVFADRGVLGATVEEICDRAGFTRGAFYSNFASKDDLVLALLNRERVQYTSGVTLMGTETVIKGLPLASRTERLKTATALYLAHMETQRDWIMVSIEIRLYAAREPGIREAYQQYRAQFHRELAAEITPLIDTYGLVLSMPVAQVVEVLDPVYESCMMDAVMQLDDHQTDVKQLDPNLLAECLAPFTAVLSAWIKESRGSQGIPESADA